MDLDNKRIKIKEVIRKNNVEVLEEYLSDNNLTLKDLNNGNFDALIYSIENNCSREVIKYIIDQCQYKSYNFYISEDSTHRIPLFSAIAKNNFELADFLLKQNANINCTINSYNILYYFNKFGLLNGKNLIYILGHGFNFKNRITPLIYELIENKRNDLLKIIFRHFFCDQNFILSLLEVYKNRAVLSTRQIKNILAKEKSKNFINETMYKKASDKENVEALKILFDYDGSDRDVVFCRVHKYEILDKAVKSNNYAFVKDILSYSAFGFKNIISESLLVEANRNGNIDIMKLLIKASLNSLSKKSKSKSKLKSNSESKSKLNNPIDTSHSHDTMTSEETIYDNSDEIPNNPNETNHDYNETNDNPNETNDDHNETTDHNKTNDDHNETTDHNKTNDHPNENYDDHEESNDSFITVSSATTTSVTEATVETEKISTGDRTQKYDLRSLNLILNMAIKIKNMKLVEYLIEDEEFKSMIDINRKDTNNEYPLIIAIYSGNIEIFEYLLDHGGNSNTKDNNGNPLISLAINNNPILVKYLLKRPGVDINAKDANGNYPLINAINQNDIDNVILLVKYGNDHDIDLDINDMNGNTPLTLSYKLEHLEIFRFLVKYLDMINKKDSIGNSILYYSINEGDAATTKFLIGNGVDVNFQDKFGNSALHISIYKKNREIISTLLQNKNIVLNTVNRRGESPLITMIKINDYSVKDNEDIIKELIKRGSAVNFIDGVGNSPLVYALQKRTLPIVKLLIKKGANVNFLIQKRNQSILMYAIELGEADIVKHLIKSGADINFVNRQGVSILRKASEIGNKAIFEYLLKSNANNCITGDLCENDILYSVISKNQMELLKILVANNLDINIPDKEGNTVLAYAIKNRSFDILKYLVANGADIHNINNHGQSIEDINYYYNYDNYWNAYNKISSIIKSK